MQVCMGGYGGEGNTKGWGSRDKAWLGWGEWAYKCGAGEHSSTHLSQTKSPPPSYPSFLHFLWNLIMDIPIQYPWYRRAFPHRLSDLSLAEPLTDWPLIWPFPWSFSWIRPSFMRWLNWPNNGHSEMRIEKDRYIIHVDVKFFSPEELSVNIGDEFITVHGKHEGRQDDHGFVSREFLRKYRLPAGVSSADVNASLSFDGILTITAPRSSPGSERTIPVSCEDGTPKQKM